jgi:3-dehydroquinate dehydratase
MRLDFRQAADPETLFQWIARESEGFDGVVFNPSGYPASIDTSTDNYVSAIQVIVRNRKPLIEVHTGNIYRDGAEPGRLMHEPGVDIGFICGFGLHGYLAAIRAIGLRLDGRGKE